MDVQELLKLEWGEQDRYLETLSVEGLESLAIELYDLNYSKVDKELLGMVTHERAIRINQDFVWTPEKRQRFLQVSKELTSRIEAGYEEAWRIADSLEERIKNGDVFLNDYEVDLKVTPYMKSNEAEVSNDWKTSIELVLSEPKSWFSVFEESVAGHFHYDTSSVRVSKFIDTEFNWNVEYLRGVFDDSWVDYAIHWLLDLNWSFQDIVNIDHIWVDVAVKYQSFRRF